MAQPHNTGSYILDEETAEEEGAAIIAMMQRAAGTPPPTSDVGTTFTVPGDPEVYTVEPSTRWCGYYSTGTRTVGRSYTSAWTTTSGH